MYNEFQKSKIQKFFLDKSMVDVVKDIMIKSFLKPRGHDVHLLAASKLAVDYLNEAFKEMELLLDKNQPEKESENPAL